MYKQGYRIYLKKLKGNYRLDNVRYIHYNKDTYNLRDIMCNNIHFQPIRNWCWDINSRLGKTAKNFKIPP